MIYTFIKALQFLRTFDIGKIIDKTSITSGNATNIIGGQVQGKGVKVDAKELNIESLQDTATYKSKQQNIEGQATVGFGGASVSGSASKSNIDANYASVNEQSGIFAGDDGYQVNVKNNTDLKGAIITSTQTAESLGKNNLSTGTLTTSDIHNSSEYNAKGIGISASANVNGGWDKSGKDKEGRGSNTVNKSVGFGLDSDKASSTTSSGINTKSINIADEAAQQALTGKTAEQSKADIFTTVTTDTASENSGAIANNFDKDKVQSEINLQVEVTKRFDQNRQEAGFTVENITDAVKFGVDGYKKHTKVVKDLNAIYSKLDNPEDQQLFVDLMKAVVQDNKATAESSAAPVAAAGVGAGVAWVCIKNPVGCAKISEKTGTALIALGIQIGILSGEEDTTQTAPKPLPSTSGNSATGGPQHDPDFNANDSKTRDAKWWKDQGFDPHKYKAEILKQKGINQPVSRYDMYVHKSGEVLLRRKNTSDFIRTGEYIK